MLLAAELPGSPASLSELAHSLVVGAKRRGVLDERFFYRLLSQYPEHRQEVQRISRMFGHDGIAPPERSSLPEDSPRLPRPWLSLNLRLGRLSMLITFGLVVGIGLAAGMGVGNPDLCSRGGCVSALPDKCELGEPCHEPDDVGISAPHDLVCELGEAFREPDRCSREPLLPGVLGICIEQGAVHAPTSPERAYWLSYDFAVATPSESLPLDKNIFENPLDFEANGAEIIFNLPNGLQAYMLVDPVGHSPLDSLNCMGCHAPPLTCCEAAFGSCQ